MTAGAFSVDSLCSVGVLRDEGSRGSSATVVGTGTGSVAPAATGGYADSVRVGVPAAVGFSTLALSMFGDGMPDGLVRYDS